MNNKDSSMLKTVAVGLVVALIYALIFTATLNIQQQKELRQLRKEQLQIQLLKKTTQMKAIPSTSSYTLMFIDELNKAIRQNMINNSKEKLKAEDKLQQLLKLKKISPVNRDISITEINNQIEELQNFLKEADLRY